VSRRLDITRNLLPLTASLRAVMQRLNEGVGGIALIVDDAGRLRGVLTDGDIRRAIVVGKGLETPAEQLIGIKFTVGRADAEHTSNLALLNEKIRHLPIVDADNRPVDLLSWADLWRVPLAQPALGGNEVKYVNDCLATGWVSSQGSYIEKFQNAFQTYMGGGLALSTSSGTTALHLALAALGIGPGDEVIVPDLTFGATANAVLHAGATPVFVDIDPATWTLDPAAMAAAVTPRTRAVIPVHLYGHPCDMDAIMDVARRHKLFVVEDCAESLGAQYKNRKAGIDGDVGCFSFFANKMITTGEGGMVLTRDPALHAKMAVLRDHGMTKERRYWHEYPGFNYRMTNLQAALGLAQMERIEVFLQRRRDIVARYDKRLTNIQGIILPPRMPWAVNVHWLYTVSIDEPVLGISRDMLLAKLNERGIETRKVFFPLHPQPAFRAGVAHDCPVSEHVARRGVSLPTSNDLTIADVDRVCDAITDVVRTQLVFQVRRA
jgi:perosamine synthetase